MVLRITYCTAQLVEDILLTMPDNIKEANSIPAFKAGTVCVVL